MKVEYYRYPIFGVLFTGSLMLIALCVNTMWGAGVVLEKVLILVLICGALFAFMWVLVRWGFAYELEKQSTQRPLPLGEEEHSPVPDELDLRNLLGAGPEWRFVPKTQGFVNYKLEPRHHGVFV